ncbi:MAG TPA: multiheme c-type cytochrome [Acidobacteriota bacterium]|nr:multiheme c-type cytochrome [Acidobacteriota bacterium]
MKVRSFHLVCLPILIAVAVSAAYAAPTYIGADKCKLCHKIQYDSWSKTKHAKAFNSLKPEEKAKKECTECHTTAGKTELAGIQCEACHGPGSDYKAIGVMKDKAKSIAAGLKVPTEKDCVACHNKKSPTFKSFNFAEAVKKVHDHKKPA